MVPFLPSRIDFSICASVAAFCQAWSLKLRTPCFAKTALGSPSLPWQGEQLFAKIFAASSAAAGTGARTRAAESGESDEGDAADGHEVSPPE